jgi:hypothetical protein
MAIFWFQSVNLAKTLSVPGFEIPRQMVVQAQADGISIVHRPLAAAFSFCCSLRKYHLEHL